MIWDVIGYIHQLPVVRNMFFFRRKTGLSRQEVNLRRLLAKCELMYNSKEKPDDRFPKYIISLEDMLQEVKKFSDPNSEFLPEYQRRIAALKLQFGFENVRYDNAVDPETERNDLLGVRHRNVGQNSEEDLGELIQYHDTIQKKITDEMLILTKNLKEQSELANKIIKKDTEVVGKSSQISEQNYSKLAVESQRLAEHSKRVWKCWLWLMLIVVIVIFINMVLFMKVMKKK